MATRAIIARAAGDGWEGVYHHFDGYPSGLGHTLHALYHEAFGGDVERMIRVLIDEHRGGWSTIHNVDWSQEPGFTEDRPWDLLGREKLRPQCYCHGDRSEGPYPLRTAAKAARDWYEYEEYLYVIVPRLGLLEVWDTHHPYPVPEDASGEAWRPTLLGRVALDDPVTEELWSRVEDGPESV